MTNAPEIYKFDQRDDLEPLVRQKLNENFRRIQRRLAGQDGTDRYIYENAGVRSYPELSDLPSINEVTLLGDIDFDEFGVNYAISPEVGGNSSVANAILYGKVDATSTNKVFTASVEGLDRLVDGTCVMLHNGVVTSASGFTVNINGLGAKKCYNNMTNATQDTTIFNVNYTMLFVYSSDLDSGNGGWWIYRGYDANTNTIGYQLRTNSGTLPASDKFYRYRILFTSADGSHWVPSTTSTSTNATALRDVNQRPIDPFGPIVYYGTTTAVEANANVAAAQLWQQYTVTFGYAFNRTGAALNLNFPAPVYIKCAPQSDGSAIIDADTPYVQALPNSADGKIYIFLGIAYSATAIELRTEHPIYYYSDGALRQWVNAPPASAPGTTDYLDLINKPSIEGVELVGDKDFPELGIFIDPEEQYPASDDYALTTVEITALWNAAQS